MFTARVLQAANDLYSGALLRAQDGRLQQQFAVCGDDGDVS